MSDRKKQLADLLAKEPNDTFLLFALGMEHAKLGEIVEALAQFDRVLAIDPKYVTAYAQKANLCERLKRFDDAKRTYQAGIAVAAARGDRHAASKMQESLDRLTRVTGG